MGEFTTEARRTRRKPLRIRKDPLWIACASVLSATPGCNSQSRCLSGQFRPGDDAFFAGGPGDCGVVGGADRLLDQEPVLLEPFFADVGWNLDDWSRDKSQRAARLRDVRAVPTAGPPGTRET